MVRRGDRVVKRDDAQEASLCGPDLSDEDRIKILGGTAAKLLGIEG